MAIEKDSNPLVLFNQWFADARARQEIVLPESMVLSTATKKGVPSARVVLMKTIDDRGVQFFTNYKSHKGQELAKNPHASLLFHWVTLERQVRFEGKITKVSKAESDAYWVTRPKGSKIGAWASAQSEEIGSWEELGQRVTKLEAQYPGDTVPRPPHWGGYVLKPERIEFWQGMPNRLHKRWLYTRAHKGWKITMLSP